MSAEKNSTNKIRQGKKTSASCFTCFSSSADSDSGLPEESKPGAGSKRKLSSCFSWPRCRNTKKKRKKENAALLNAPTLPSTDLNAVEGRSPLAQECNSGIQTKIEDQQQQQQQAEAEDDPKLDSRGQHVVTHISPEIDCRSQLAPQIGARSSRPTTSRFGRASPRGPVRSERLVLSVVGPWITVATLAVMVFSGRAAAIICLCSCFYLLPLYRWPVSADAWFKRN
ncbi:uncharacterized protein LOC108952640 [Musa acuminata AAA Group]|uniref:uncharacterized protein LOC108952640 n=1 Tax=Musa acuminata AAA Group TaxID=214697 RepID=UPI0031DDCFC4